MSARTGILLLLSLVSFSPLAAADRAPAFPGAEGFGADTQHARTRRVFVVTNLEDQDKAQSTRFLKPGGFRHALASAEQAGGGYIVFAVAGTIQLKRDAVVPSQTYIAGQSAPGTGIAIEGGSIVIGSAAKKADRRTNDVVVRHLRSRGRMKKGGDAFLISKADNVVLDHVSTSFFRDGAVDIVDSTNVTLQWSHFGDASDSGTNEPYHCEPHLLRDGANRVSIHHNYYTHVHSRVPWAKDTNEGPDFLIEFSNNVVYNYRKYPTSFDAPMGRGNVVGNLYLAGRFTHADEGRQIRPLVVGSNGFTVHVRDNLAIGGMGHTNQDANGKSFKGKDQDVKRGQDASVSSARPDNTAPETDIMGVPGERRGPKQGVLNYSSSRISDCPEISLRSAEQNLNDVLTWFGALPRDQTDQRLAQEFVTRTGEWKLEIPDDRNIYSGTADPDADSDGMSDLWEKSRGRDLKPNDHDLDPQFENIEVYLNELADKLVQQAAPVDGSAVLKARPRR